MPAVRSKVVPAGLLLLSLLDVTSCESVYYPRLFPQLQVALRVVADDKGRRVIKEECLCVGEGRCKQPLSMRQPCSGTFSADPYRLTFADLRVDCRADFWCIPWHLYCRDQTI